MLSKYHYQISNLKRKKDDTIEKVTDEYEALFREKIVSTKLMKKVNNMETWLKKKTDMKATENKRIHEVVVFQCLCVYSHSH